MSDDDDPQPMCHECRGTWRAISWQRQLLLDMANVLKINLNELEGDTAEAEWEHLGKLIKERMINVGS